MNRGLAFLALSVATFFLIGFYFETNDDLQVDLLFRGYLSPQPIEEIKVLFPFLSSLFGFLYGHFPEFPVYSFFIILSGILYGLLLLRFLHLILLPSLFPDKLWVNVILFSVLLFPHLVLSQFTRFSILIPFLSFLLSLLDQKKKYLVLYLTLYVLYSFVRAHSFYLVCFLVLLPVLLSHFLQPLRLVRPSSIRITLLTVILVGFLLKWHEIRYIQMEPFLTNELRFIADVVNNHCVYALRTKEEQITFEVIDHWLMGDRVWLTKEHLSAISPGKLISWYKIKLKYRDLWENKVLLLLLTKYLLVSMFIIMIAWKLWKDIGWKIWPLSIIILFFVFVAGLLTVLMKMPSHLAEPLISLLTLCFLWFTSKEIHSLTFMEKWVLLFAFFCFVGCSFWEYKDLNVNGKSYSLAWKESEKKVCGKEVIVGDYAMSRFQTYPIFSEAPFQTCNKHFLLGGWTGWLSESQEQIAQLTGIAHLSSLFVPHPNRIWIFADGEEKRYEALVLMAYQKKVQFEPFGQPGPYMQKVHLAWYTLAER